jgi:hypothetical protein
MPYAAAAFALVLAAPSAASAQASTLGARIGLGLPFGDTAGNGPAVRDLTKSVVPIQIDLGLKLGKPVMIGAYLGYGFGQLADEADGRCGAADCSASVIRLGLQGAIHSEVSSGREIWAGVLFGWERLHFDAPSPDDVTANGWEFGLQGGFDFSSATSGFGPFVSLSVGQFGDLSGTDVSVGERKTHGTLQVGVRGYFKT